MARAWMPLYVGDYLADTGHLSTVEHGAYLLLIMHYWQRGSLPTDDARLASIARASLEQWLSIKPTISSFFDENWRHVRIEEEAEKGRIAHEKRKLAGKLGGQAKAKSSSNAKAMLEQCSANHNHNHILVSPTDLSAEVSADPPLQKFNRKPNKEKTTLLTSVGERWNDLASSYGLPCIQTIDGGRERACLARAQELTKTYEYENAETGFEDLFSKIRSSSFLRGDAKPRNGGAAFRATFDWVMSPSNFRKIMENTYG